MRIEPGTRIGPYEILAPLGAGGMGEVYRARDTRLGREVAVKVLPQHMSGNADLRARFEREARTVSSLNHPHICTLHDVGRAGDIDYLVMELVEGETLAARLARGALPLPEVLRIGIQVADALERAHRAGVMHRDLKPGNVMLTKSGAKLMDFGLARNTGMARPGGASFPGSGSLEGAFTATPTVAGPLTAEGTLVGTFQYMAPELLEGQAPDARADLWALGCVLYEMAAGRRAFDGKSQASLINAIMGKEPAPLAVLAPAAPPAFDRIVGACLAKDPADRIQSAHDVKLHLSWIAEGISKIEAAAPQAPAHGDAGRAAGALDGRHPGGRRGVIAWMAVAAVAGALVLGAVAGYVARGRRVATAASAADLRYQAVTFEEGFIYAARFAPDGRTIVYSADWARQPRDLFVTSLDNPEFRPLGFRGADLMAISGAGDLAILGSSVMTGGSPWTRRGTLTRASLTGGAGRAELDGVHFADFGPDQTMAVVRDEGRRLTIEYPLGKVLADSALPMGPTGAQPAMVNPRVSPSGEHVAVFHQGDRGQAVVVKIFDRSGKVVAASPAYSDWWGLAWAPPGDLWFAATEEGGNQVVVFSLGLDGRQRVVFRAPGGLTLHDISPRGDVLASFDHPREHVELVAASDTVPQSRSWRDGSRLNAMSDAHALLLSQQGDSGGAQGSVFFWQPGDQHPTRIASGRGLALSADGRKALVVSSETPRTVSVVPTGAGLSRTLDLGGIETLSWAAWHPDGRIVIDLVRPDGKSVVQAVSADGRTASAVLPEGLSMRGGNVISPDGSRIVAVDASSQLQVCALGSPACVPLGGADEQDEVAGWTADGNSVFVYKRRELPVRVDLLDVASGKRSAFKEVHPSQTVVYGIRSLVASPDGALALGYSRPRSELYVIKGLK